MGIAPLVTAASAPLQGVRPAPPAPFLGGKLAVEAVDEEIESEFVVREPWGREGPLVVWDLLFASLVTHYCPAPSAHFPPLSAARLHPARRPRRVLALQRRQGQQRCEGAHRGAVCIAA